MEPELEPKLMHFKKDKKNHRQLTNLNHFLLSEVTSTQWSGKLSHLVSVKYNLMTVNSVSGLPRVILWFIGIAKNRIRPSHKAIRIRPKSVGESAGFWISVKNAGIRHLWIRFQTPSYAYLAYIVKFGFCQWVLSVFGGTDMRGLMRGMAILPKVTRSY